MLSKIDISIELGKNIAIYPFYRENLKDSSYNLTAGKFAWTQIESSSGGFSYKGKKYKKGDLCCDGKKIIMFPHCVTLVETAEVLAVSNKISGSFHSRVTLVNLGIGHISTLLGPNWCGHCLIALHNITEHTICLDVGTQICSVVFEYVSHAVQEKNLNVNGHTDKFSSYGIHLTVKEENEINEDWKKIFHTVKEKMVQTDDFRLTKKDIKSTFKSYFNKRNIIVFLIITILIVGIFVGAHFLDKKSNQTIWRDRAWTIFSSGILIYIIQLLVKKIGKKD